MNLSPVETSRPWSRHPATGSQRAIARVLRHAAIGAVALLLRPTIVPAAAADAPAVRVELADGRRETGRLVGLDADGLTLVTDAGDRTFPLVDLRVAEPATRPVASRAVVRVWLADGGHLDGDDVAWEENTLAVSRSDGRAEIPVARVRSVEWMAAGEVATAPAGAGPAWAAGLPETVESDLLVVASADGTDFVECAVKSISPDTVTVVLDDETIPVKRTKVVGIHWLRAPATPETRGAVAFDLVGGALRGRRVEWTPEGAVLDGEVRLPAAAVARIDWAAGRTVSLATLAPEKLDVEPWFGALAKVPGMEGFFAPRPVESGEEFPRPGLVIRPRTLAVWRLPPQSRVFRATLAPAAGAGASGATVVAVAVDDVERFRATIDAGACAAEHPEGVAVEVDVTGGRRVALSVDFGGASDPGGPVRLSAPVIEQ